MTGSQLRDSGRPCDSPRSWGPAPGGLELVGGGLRSSRGRTRTCDPLTPNGHDRVLGRRKIRDWRAGNPEETSETHPNRTRPTVPEPYRAKRSETSEQHRSPPNGVQFSLAAYRRFTPSRGGVGNTTLERRQGVGLLYIVCLMTPRQTADDWPVFGSASGGDGRVRHARGRRGVRARGPVPSGGRREEVGAAQATCCASTGPWLS